MAIGIPANHRERKKHGLTKVVCEEIALQAIRQLDWIEIGYLKDALDYRTRGSLLTFAERIKVYIGETEILVISECLFPGQFLDFGKNKRNVQEFFEKFEGLKSKL